MNDLATAELVLAEIRGTRDDLRTLRGEVRELSDRLVLIEASQKNTPTLAQHESVAQRLAWHEAACRENTGRLIAIDEDFEKRLRALEDRVAPNKLTQVGTIGGAAAGGAGLVEGLRLLLSWLGKG